MIVVTPLDVQKASQVAAWDAFYLVVTD